VNERRPEIDFPVAHSARAQCGVYETLLVRDGRALEQRRHLERLSTSLHELYAAELPERASSELARAAAGQALARLRVEAVPSEGAPPILRCATEPIGVEVLLAAQPVALTTVGVRGCAGPHKLRDRSWLAQIEELAGPARRALLVSTAGELLETTRANVFLVRDGVLATPPLDGRILPGTVRAALLEHAQRLGIETHQEPLGLRELVEADVVLLSGSLRLLERAEGGGGRRSTLVADRLADALAASVLGGSLATVST
jgi:para-aminobenzoate synthetase/4-amino-4-deoxychorismate lyase